MKNKEVIGIASMTSLKANCAWNHLPGASIPARTVQNIWHCPACILGSGLERHKFGDGTLSAYGIGCPELQLELQVETSG